jgi:hypothetical protein
VTVLLEDLAKVLHADEWRCAAVDRRQRDVLRELARQVARAIVVPAAGSVPAANVGDGRLLGTAPLVGEGATISEDASGQIGSEAGQEPGNRVEPTVVLADAATGNAAEQPDRVRMTRVLEHRLDRPLLDEPAGVEDTYAGAHLGDDSEVVADEEHRRVQLGLELSDQIEHFRLDRRVETGRRLVEDEQRRILRQRHRDHDPLLHPAGELMRVPLHH